MTASAATSSTVSYPGLEEFERLDFDPDAFEVTAR